jgi:hypothetical protein
MLAQKLELFPTSDALYPRRPVKVLESRLHLLHELQPTSSAAEPRDSPAIP